MEKKNKNRYFINSLADVEITGCTREVYFTSQIVCENNGNTTTEVMTGEEFLLFSSSDTLPANLPDQIVMKGQDKDYYARIRTTARSEEERDFISSIALLLGKLEKKSSDKEKTAKELYQVLREYDKFKSKKPKEQQDPTYTMFRH